MHHAVVLARQARDHCSFAFPSTFPFFSQYLCPSRLPQDPKMSNGILPRKHVAPESSLSLSLSLSGELCCCENSPRVVVFVNMFGGRTSTYKLWRTTSSACFMSTMMSMPLHHLVSCRSTHVSCCLSSSYFSGNSHNLSTSSSSVLRVHLLQLCGITRLTSSSTSSATDVNPWQRRRLLETPCSTLNGKFLRGIITIVFCGFFWMPHLRIPSFLVLRETRVEDAEEFWRQAQTTRAHAYGTARARSCGKEGSGTVQWRDLYEVLASFWLQV